MLFPSLYGVDCCHNEPHHKKSGLIGDCWRKAPNLVLLYLAKKHQTTDIFLSPQQYSILLWYSSWRPQVRKIMIWLKLKFILELTLMNSRPTR